MKIGRELRDIMEKEGFSLRRVAIDLGIDRSTLFRSLSESGNPEWKTIEKILSYLGYEIRFIKSKKKEVKLFKSYPSRLRGRKK